ncbi:MAG: heavy metal translocating P-type ATPase [Paracoccaceae bacterium]|jgi:heavy metal translocating P-type ATPase
MALDQSSAKHSHARFQITGMSCASCVGRVQNAIEAATGVTQASVNLATETADIDFTADLSLAELVKIIDATGYAAARQEVTLSIESMTCASCVGRVEKTLNHAVGVEAATVNLATETAHVRFLTGLATAESLAELVTQSGYTADVAKAEDNNSLDARRGQEIDNVGRATLIAFVLGLPVFVLAMGPHVIPGLHGFIKSSIGIQTSWLIQFALTTLVLVWPGRTFFAKGYPALLRRAPDMNSLVALGTTAAWAFSTLVVFAPSVIPAASRGVYFEAAAVIVTLILFGRWLEARAKGRTGSAIRHLIGLSPKTARVERDGQVVDLPIAGVRVGDILHLRPGESVAVDGEVMSGHSYIDASMITGEPLAVEKSEGDGITGGTINTTGSLTFRATHVGSDTVLASIIRMVQDAQGAKLPIQALVDKVTLVFVPVVLGIAALTVVVWLIFGPSLAHALVAGVAVLIIACPCAMGLATPTSIMVGTGRGAEMGVLFRKGDALQSLAGISVIALDKTGTLTNGTPVLTDFVVVDGADKDRTLGLIAALETQSEHPIAAAIVAGAKDRGLKFGAVTNFEAKLGYGASATVNGKAVAVGADRYMRLLGIDLGDLKAQGAGLATQGKTPLYAAIDGKIAAVIAVADEIRETTPAAIKAFQNMGLRVAMLTGDNAKTAAIVAEALNIDTVVAEVLPDGKVAQIKALRAKYGNIAFVGDGINDAPALAAADVGIAIGTGTDVAIETADVVLMSGDLNAAAKAVKLSRAVMRNIRQNLFWAFGYNTLLIPIAAGVLFPIFGVLLSPMLAAGAMALSSVFVLSNALRLRRIEV